jgi:DNA end-binding protein Ku
MSSNARPTWKGFISFGLVNIPVTLYSAERHVDLSFHMIDSRNNKRVRYHRVNEETGAEVPWDRIVKGYEYEDGNYVLLSDGDFKRAKPEATQTVDIQEFVEASEIDVAYFEKPFYLVPTKKGEKSYVLLREALKKSGKVGIARVVVHSREYIAAVQPAESAIVLNLLRFDDELKKPDEFDLPKGSLKDYKVSTKEMEMALQLIDSMVTEWNPKKHHDEYRKALLAWIHKKVRSGQTEAVQDVAVETEQKGAKVIDIMSLLKKSVEQHSPSSHREHRKHRGGSRR